MKPWFIEAVATLVNVESTVDSSTIVEVTPVKPEPSPINEDADTWPSTSNPVPLINCNLSDLNLAVILFEPAFLFANSISPSSEPSEASCIFAVILAYTTSWLASFSPLNFNCPR